MAVSNPSITDDDTGKVIALDESGWKHVHDTYEVVDLLNLNTDQFRIVYEALMQARDTWREELGGPVKEILTKFKMHKK